MRDSERILCTAVCSSVRAARGRPAHYRVEVALVELLHGPLQLAALRLPLLEVAHGLHGGPLPGGGPGVVVHVVHPPAVIHSSFPAAAKETNSTSKQTALSSRKKRESV